MSSFTTAGTTREVRFDFPYCVALPIQLCALSATLVALPVLIYATATAYHPAWLILDSANPGKIVTRASAPLLWPDLAWEQGIAPELCNVANVTFLEAARPLGQDRFQVYFGGSDSVVGTATVKIKVN